MGRLARTLAPPFVAWWFKSNFVERFEDENENEDDFKIVPEEFLPEAADSRAAAGAEIHGPVQSMRCAH